MIDRGATLLLAAREVGPHIKQLTEHSKVPSYVVKNASWYLRRAGIWNNNRTGRKFKYGWERDLDQGDGEGLMRDANVAAGLANVRRWDGRSIYEPSYRLGIMPTAKGFKLAAAKAPCLSALALARHRLIGEHCEVCEVAARERQARYAERQATLRSSVIERRESIESRRLREIQALQNYEEYLRTEAEAAVQKRVDGLREYYGFRNEGLTLPRPRQISLDKPLGRDRFDGGLTGDIISIQGSGHLTEWADPTFEAVANVMDAQLDAAAVALEYKPLLPLDFTDEDSLSFLIDRNAQGNRIGFSIEKIRTKVPL